MMWKPFCMSFAAALVLIAQATSPATAPQAVSGPVRVAERATATVTIRRPAQVRIGRDGTVDVDTPRGVDTVQRSRDEAGTLWIEFS